MIQLYFSDSVSYFNSMYSIKIAQEEMGGLGLYII